MTSIIDEMCPKLRRALGDVGETETKEVENPDYDPEDEDNDEPEYIEKEVKVGQVYTDNMLAEYIADAIMKLSYKWSNNHTIDEEEMLVEPKVEGLEQIIYITQAKLDILNIQPDTSFRTGTISVTRRDTLKRQMRQQIDNMIETINVNQAMGSSSGVKVNYRRSLYNNQFIKNLY